jgi:hypothetical protein
MAKHLFVGLVEPFFDLFAGYIHVANVIAELKGT